MPQTSRRKLSHSLKCKLSIFAFMWSENCQKPQLPFLAAVKVAKACHFPTFYGRPPTSSIIMQK